MDGNGLVLRKTSTTCNSSGLISSDVTISTTSASVAKPRKSNTLASIISSKCEDETQSDLQPGVS